MTKPQKRALPNCVAPGCTSAGITLVAALGPCGEFNGHLCADHLAAFYRVFPIVRETTALLVAVTVEDLIHG